MGLLINKNGKQLGPYSLDEARALVLKGTLDADDWAWPDGANDWVYLKDVPGFTMAKPAPVAAAPAAAAPAPAAAEEELWRGHPSQVLNLSIYIFWVIVLIVAAVVCVFCFGDSQFWSLVIFGVVAFIALVQIAIAYIHLRTIEYVITTQRIRVISGIFSKDIQEIELFRVKDTMARQSFFQRLFGLGTITIISGDANHPHIVLSGIPEAIELRERLRQEVMTLRQRFGVREVDVM
jgi:membrane protein YdbS with pleckstrin-like domain